MADIFTSEEEDKINMFKRTYNAYYLKNFESNKLQILKEICNPILQKLIDNLSVENTHNFQYIEGPISVKKFVLEDTKEDEIYFKTICLFGEEHIDTRQHCSQAGFNNSISFVEYLKRLSRETRSFIDVYIELPMFIGKPEGKEVESSYYDIKGRYFIIQAIKRLAIGSSIDFKTAIREEEKAIDAEYTYTGDSQVFTDIFKEFKLCLQPSTRSDEKCQLLRIHNIDVRDFWGPYIDLDDLSFSFNIIYFIIELQYTVRQTLYLFKKTGADNLIYELSLNCTTDSLYDILYNNKSIQKQLEKTIMGDYIERFIKYEIADLMDVYDFNQISLLCRIISKSRMDFSEDNLNSLASFCFEMQAIIVDLYTLCRMFKIHDVKDNFQPRESINMIVYTGHYHSQRYSKFLTWLKNNTFDYIITPIYEYHNSDLSCVKMFD